MANHLQIFSLVTFATIVYALWNIFLQRHRTTVSIRDSDYEFSENEDAMRLIKQCVCKTLDYEYEGRQNVSRTGNDDWKSRIFKLFFGNARLFFLGILSLLMCLAYSFREDEDSDLEDLFTKVGESMVDLQSSDLKWYKQNGYYASAEVGQIYTIFANETSRLTEHSNQDQVTSPTTNENILLRSLDRTTSGVVDVLLKQSSVPRVHVDPCESKG